MPARRSAQYLIQFSRDHEPCRTTAADFHGYLAAGLIEETAPKLARPRRGVLAWLRNGQLVIRRIVRMKTFAAGLERAWMFDAAHIRSRRPRETWEQFRESILLARERDSQNEALLWLIARDSMGKNEMTFLTQAQREETRTALTLRCGDDGSVYCALALID